MGPVARPLGNNSKSVLRKVLVGCASGTVAQSMHTRKHPDGEKNYHFVIPAGLLSRNDGYGNLSASQKLSRMALMVRKCIWATASSG
jgi:hypothetical protein